MDTFVREGKALLETNLSGLERYKLLREQKQDEIQMLDDEYELKKKDLKSKFKMNGKKWKGIKFFILWHKL